MPSHIGTVVLRPKKDGPAFVLSNYNPKHTRQWKESRATRAYQVYLSDQPGDLFWLTVKDGRLTETELKPEPGQPGGLPTEKIK